MANEEQDMTETFLLGSASDTAHNMTTSLEQMMNMSLDTVEEVRGNDVTPTGKYAMEIAADDMPAIVKLPPKQDEETGEMVQKVVIQYGATIIGAKTGDDELDAKWGSGDRKHFQRTFPIDNKDDFIRAMGTIKALAVDIGAVEKGTKGMSFADYAQAVVGIQFQASVVKRTSKSGFDNANIKPHSIEPLNPADWA